MATLIPDISPKRLESLGQARIEEGTLVTPPVVVPPLAQGTDWKKLGLWAVLLLSVLFSTVT